MGVSSRICGTERGCVAGGFHLVQCEFDSSLTFCDITEISGSQTFDAHTSAFYGSDEFKAKDAEASQFITSLQPYMDGRPVTLENMVRAMLYAN